MKISVVLTTYNGEKYLKKQLKSIWEQELQPDEVIISDDNSTDSTQLIVESFIKEHNIDGWVLVKNLPNNTGITNNYLNGIKRCQGDIVFLSDQDDVWKPDKIKKCVDTLKNNKDISCVISSIEYINQNDIRYEIKTRFTSKKTHIVSLKELLAVCSYLGMSAAFRRNVVVAADIELMKNSSHDWGLFIEAYRQGTILFLGDVLTCYRQHDNNASIIKETNKEAKRIQLLQRQALHIDAIIAEGVLSRKENSVCEDYSMFLRKREDFIKRKRWYAVLLNIHNYMIHKYTLRNILADLYSCL